VKAWSDVYAIDANVLLRYLVRDNEDQWVKADALIRGMADGKPQLLCDPVTLAEVVWVLKSFYKLDKHQIRDGLEPIVASAFFLIPNKDLYLHALEIYGEIGDFGDACACALALDSCEGRLLSFDKKLSRVPGLERLEELRA
jgi:predicted nucleic-acid-binding protein